MHKNAILSFPTIGENRLKKLCLSFKKLYLLKQAYENQLESNKRNRNVGISDDFITIEFLLKNGIAEFFEMDDGLMLSSKEMEQLTSFLKKLKTNNSGLDGEVSEHDLVTLGMLCLDVMTRRSVRFLKEEKGIESFPVLLSSKSYDLENKKAEVIKFVFSKIPTPHANTSWEQIIDFRKDADVHSKYLTLLNWVNSVSNSNKTLSEIEDEFEYLYDQYIRHYKLHKMKSDWTTLEIIVVAGLDALSSLTPLGLIKELFTIRKSKISLLEEEMKLSGKEIAYIYKTNETFNN